MTVFHCYICDNVDHRLLALHKEACKLAKVKTKYHTFKINEILKEGLSPHQKHGWFMEHIFKTAQEETIGFIDIDCIILSSMCVDKWSKTVEQSGTILGAAQSANHLPSRMEVYPGPAMMIAHKHAWDLAGQPSLIADNEYDTGQKLYHELSQRGYHVDVIMPKSHSPEGESWQLGDKGRYGIGTIYGDGEVFHLFQASQGPSYVHLLEEKVRLLQNQASSRNESSS